jgi:hypothetical protein
MTNLKTQLNSMFDLTDIGEPNKIIGIEITRKANNSIFICQHQYIESILKREGMMNASPVKTPLDLKTILEPNPEGEEGNRSNAFACLIGSLQYLSTATRPDITYAVNRLSAYTANPSMVHYTAAKRILRYLAGTKNFGITYSRGRTYLQFQGENPFYGYADVAYANSDGLRSTTGYVFIASGGAITWGSKKQSLVALSSTEAEYIALSEAARDAKWLEALYDELSYSRKGPILLLGDNNGSLAIANNSQYHKRSKHIDIRYH